MKCSTPYLTYGNGFEEDNRINDEEYFCGDILNLGKEMEKEYPNDVYANLHRMFQIGFRCGIRKERETLYDKHLFDHSGKLTSLAQQLDLVERYLENLECYRIAEDNENLQFQIHRGTLGILKDNIEIIRENIEKISNDMCVEV